MATLSTRRSSRSSHDGSRAESSRRTVACMSCHKMKTRCVGVPPEQCDNCRARRIRCCWPDQSARTVISKDELNRLKIRIQELECRLGDVTVGDTPTADAEGEGDHLEVYEDNNPFGGSVTLLGPDRSTHIGPSHSGYLGWLLSGSTRNLELDVDPQHDSVPRRMPSFKRLQLPPVALAMMLFERQYVYIGTIFSFVQRPRFEALLRHFQQYPPDMSSQESCLNYCLVLLVLSYGYLYYDNHALPEVPGLTYFRHALSYMPELHEQSSVLFVEVTSLAAYFLQVLSRRDAAYLYIGAALRMSISLGLHQELADTSIDEAQKEHRRRVWWSVYSMDRILSVKSGNPISIHDEDVGANWPSYLEELDGQSSSAKVLSKYSQLSQLLGKIGEGIYRARHRSSQALLETIQSLMNELRTWLSSLPPDLINPSTPDGHISREAVSTLSHYYQCVNLTTRPLLFSVMQKRLRAKRSGTASLNWKADFPADVVAIIDYAMQTARESSRVILAALRRGLFATYGFMDGEHAFSAALILVMASIAFDNDEMQHVNKTAMDNALYVLRTMADQGNRYLEARHALLNDLLSLPYHGEDTTAAAHEPELGDMSPAPPLPPAPPQLSHDHDQDPSQQRQPLNFTSYIQQQQPPPPSIQQDTMTQPFQDWYPQPFQLPDQFSSADYNMDDVSLNGIPDEGIMIQIAQEFAPWSSVWNTTTTNPNDGL